MSTEQRVRHGDRGTQQPDGSVPRVTTTIKNGRNHRIRCWGWSVREVEERGSEIQGDPWLHTEFEASLCYMTPCLKRMKHQIHGSPTLAAALGSRVTWASGLSRSKPHP